MPKFLLSRDLLAQHSIARHKLAYCLYAEVRKKQRKWGFRMGGKTDLDRVVAYVPTAWKRELEAWAEAEERSVSWLVSKLIDKALQERQKRQQPSEIVNMP